MIVFNGVSINSVANVKIEDIRVSPIAYNPVARPRAIRFGSDFVRMGGGTRTVDILFAVLDDNKVTRQEAFLNLAKWARSDAEYMLELPQDPNKYLMCVCTAKPEPSTRQWWESKLRLTFTCFDNPYWTSKAEKSVACGTQFNVLGDAPPLMRIELDRNSAANNQTYSNGTQSMTFSTIPAGKMVLDLNNQTAIVDFFSIMNNYQASSQFLIPKTGVQTITGNGLIKYKERWE